MGKEFDVVVGTENSFGVGGGWNGTFASEVQEGKFVDRAKVVHTIDWDVAVRSKRMKVLGRKRSPPG
jgi:hypothetical protein